MGHTPRSFLLPHVFHLVGERYHVIPNGDRECCLVEILEHARLSGEIVGGNHGPDLDSQPFNR